MPGDTRHMENRGSLLRPFARVLAKKGVPSIPALKPHRQAQPSGATSSRMKGQTPVCRFFRVAEVGVGLGLLMVSLSLTPPPARSSRSSIR